jgi:hypothetical protein
MLHTFFAKTLRTLELRPRLRFTLILLATISLVAASYADLLSYPGVATGVVTTAPPMIGQGIHGYVSYGPLTPACRLNWTLPESYRQELPTGIVYGHGLTLNVPISWSLGSCGAYGEFQVILNPPGVYHFTLSSCTSTIVIGCANLPATVIVLPFQMTEIDISADTGIR